MATGRGGVGGRWHEFVSEHLGSISHPPHLAGAFEIWCQLTVGAEVHVLSHEGQLWVPPGSAFWGTLTSFAFSLEVYPLDATIDFSLSSCFMAICFSVRVPSLLGQLQATFVCGIHTDLGKQPLCPSSTIHPLHSLFALLPICLIQPLDLCKLPDGRDWLGGKLGFAVVKEGSCSVKLL